MSSKHAADDISTLITEFQSGLATHPTLWGGNGSTSSRTTTTGKSTSLQSRNVKNILLVSSLYDSFIFEEGGGPIASSSLYTLYGSLNLSRQPPKITRVSSLKESVTAISEGKTSYDLVICFLRRAAGTDLWVFLQTINEIAPRVPVLLLASNTRELSTLDPRVDTALRVNIHKTSGWERAHKGAEHIWSWPFLWQGDFSLIFAMVKTVEDRLNVAEDVKTGDVRVIIVVEDNVQFYSSYLPMIYKLAFNLTRDVLKESPNDRRRIEDRLRRPKILLCNSYEEAVEIFQSFPQNVLGVITDVGFHKEGQHDETAGLEFTKYAKAQNPHLPILVQSSDSANEEKAIGLGASFLLKSDPQLLNGLKSFMELHLGFGPFRFALGKGETKLKIATTLMEFGKTLNSIPDEIVRFHLNSDHFRIWFAAHTHFALAEAVNNIRTSNISDDKLKSAILSAVFQDRKASRAALITEFDAELFAYDDVDELGCVLKWGTGSLGGKGHGLAFLNSVLQKYRIKEMFPQLTIYVPLCLILATGIFDHFMEDNALYKIALARDATDDVITAAFANAHLSHHTVQALRVFLTRITCPLAVRSSSVFEDAMDKPYAGIYDTYMIPNNNTDVEERLKQLVYAIKMVYASTYKKIAVDYEHSSGTRPEEAKMAVVIQKVAGRTHQDKKFYPDVAGVAGSYDVYAKSESNPKNGYCAMALGLGGTVVGGGYHVRFSPGNPRDSLWKTQQKKYMGVDLAGVTGDSETFDVSPDMLLFAVPVGETPSLHKRQGGPQGSPTNRLKDVHGDIIQIDSSVSGNATTTTTTNGSNNKRNFTIRQMELAEIIKDDIIPISKILSLLLQVGTTAMSFAVEMEFAMNFETSESGNGDVDIKFMILQMRAMPGAMKTYVPRLSMNDVPVVTTTICHSRHALGHGLNEEIRDIVYVPSDGFDTSKTREVATQIGEITRKLHKEKKPYVLIGPGRWGTATPNLGIPVTWSQICGAGCIVEAPLSGGPCVPSQGTHFFQNITSFDIPYFTIGDDGGVNEDWLEKYDKSKVGCVGNVRHLSLDDPVQVVVDGVSRCGVVMLPRCSYSVFVDQANAFLDMANLPCA